MKKIVYIFILIIIFLFFLVINYFISGTPYSRESNCNKVKIGDSLPSVIWQLGIPSYRLSETDGIKVLGYPIPIATYANIPKNEVRILNNKVINTICITE